jgi:subtilisin family serine protease
MSEFNIPPVRIDSVPMDAKTLAQQIDWGLRERSMPDVWKWCSGSGVLVIVLDTGVPQHSDLPEHAFAYNFTNSSTPFDRNGHQTHCAGIVAAKNDNDGVVGWAPEATLGHIKVLGDRGGGLSTWITQGIRTATAEWKKRKADYVGCVISMSLGGEYDVDQQQAIIEANEAGAIVVAAAGNSGYRGGSSTVDHPGASAFTLGVAAYRNDGAIANFSSGGPEVDIAMPGEEILSTVPGNKYQVMSGTSMATPAAAGLLACILSSRPRDTSIRNIRGMKAFLKEHSEDRGQLGQDNRFGFGVPEATELVRNPEYWFF